jgi:hypothetical protein
MAEPNKYIIVNGKDYPLTRVINDCDLLGLCVPTAKGESLQSILKKLCAKIGNIEVPTQVNADWNATQGLSQILNKPLIPSQYTDAQAISALTSILSGEFSTTGNTISINQIDWSKITNVPALGLQTEVDPVWTLEKVNYYTKTEANGLFYPLSSNPAGYLTSFTEQDPIALAKTITVNGTTQALSSNPSFTVPVFSGDYNDLINQPVIPVDTNTNIYNSDGTIEANRTVDLAGKLLKFTTSNPYGTDIRFNDQFTFIRLKESATVVDDAKVEISAVSDNRSSTLLEVNGQDGTFTQNAQIWQQTTETLLFNYSHDSSDGTNLQHEILISDSFLQFKGQGTGGVLMSLYFKNLPLSTGDSDTTDFALFTDSAERIYKKVIPAGFTTADETDPIFLASAANTITTTNITNWNTAYGWGNHASAGYALASAIPTNNNQLTNGSGYITSAALVPYALTSAIPTNNNQLTNGNGYITSSALTPYLTSATAASTYQPIGTYATATNSMAFTNKTGNISQWTNDAGYLTTATAASTYATDASVVHIAGTETITGAKTFSSAITSQNMYS